MMYGYTSDWSWGSILPMALNMVLFFAVFGILLWAVLRWMGQNQRSDAPQLGTSARDILQQRYARGEIDAGTYEEMLARLTGSTPSSASPRS